MDLNSEDAARLGAAFIEAIEEARTARKVARKSGDRMGTSSTECFAAHRKVGLLLYSLADADKITAAISKILESKP